MSQNKGKATRIGNYTVANEVGKGGMGTVYKGYDESLDRHVAIKVLSAELSSDAEFVERFKREAKVAASLSHPNIVHIYSIGEKENLYYYAMEYIDGRSLADILESEGKIPAEKAIEYAIQVARGLEHAFRKGVIHRDVKPSNLMLTSDGLVKIADFGLSKLIKSARSLTATGIIFGTPHYISPEQGKGDPTDHRSDIYSLGATLYHLVTGHPPFEGDTPVGILMKHITAPLPPVDEKNPEIPQQLAKIIHKMMEKDPERRYQTYEELIRDLEKARPRELIVAPFWPRALATIIDGFPLWLSFTIFSIAANHYPQYHIPLVIVSLVSFAVYCLVFALFSSGGRQALGMRNLNLMILTTSRKYLTYSHALKRVFFTQLPSFVLLPYDIIPALIFWAYIIPAVIYHRFNKRKRSFQDIICKTMVVYHLR